MSDAAIHDVLDVLDNLPGTLRGVRILRGVSLRQAALEIGVSFGTVRRIESGEDANLSHVRMCLEWLRRAA